MNCDHFISCDWGTSHLRVRLVEVSSVKIVAEVRSTDGIASIAESESDPSKRAEAFRTKLESVLAELGETTDLEASKVIVISGMASSSIGWQNLPYAELPFALSGTDMVWQELDPVSKQRVFLLSGMRAEHDIIRGEETEVLGLFSDQEISSYSKSSVLILPGTHSKHILINDSKVCDFKTYMTGELFQILCSASVLQHSVDAVGSQSRMVSVELKDSFSAGVSWGASRELASALFRVRADHVLFDRSADKNAAFLSGVLLGAELKSYVGDSERKLVLSAGKGMRDLYQVAAEVLELSSLHIVSEHLGELAAVFGQILVIKQLN